MNKQKKTEYNRFFWRMIKIAIVITITVAHFSVDSGMGL